jgi:hypothetical protein
LTLLVVPRHNSEMPGKFETSGALGALFYAMANAGFADDETGDTTEYGRWYAIFEGPFNLAELKKNFPEEWAKLDANDVRELMKAKGVILTEDAQGFVDIKIYTSKKKLDQAWNEIEAAVSEFYEAE